MRNPGDHRRPGHDLEVIGGDVLPDQAYGQRHRPALGQPGAGGQGLGGDGRAQVQAGHEQDEAAGRDLGAAGQVDQDEVVVRAQRLQGGADARRAGGPAAPVSGQDGHAEPGGQDGDQAVGAEGGLLGGQVAPAQAGDDVVPDEQAEASRRVGVQQRHPGAGDGAGAREVEQEGADAQSAAGPGEHDDAGARRVLGAQQGGDEPVGAVGRGELLQGESAQAASAQVLDGGVGEHVDGAKEEDGVGGLRESVDDVGQVAHGAQHRVAAGAGAHESEDLLDPGLGQGVGQRLRQGIGRRRARWERGGGVGPGGGARRVVRCDKGDGVGLVDRSGTVRQDDGNGGIGRGRGSGLGLNDSIGLNGGLGPSGGARPSGGNCPRRENEDTDVGRRRRLIGDGRCGRGRHGAPRCGGPCRARRVRRRPGARRIQEGRRCGRVGHGSSLGRGGAKEDRRADRRARSGRCREDRGIPLPRGAQAPRPLHLQGGP